ncbi:MAG TPA: hypothetical protein VGN63_20150 [Flavisolibacter sp.]|jgi:hypothetical protein|nr:hypothetical protein [Flavisolibacter sp.]
MSENLPYHDEQWENLPLPNEEEAWLKMQLLLDEQDKRRRLLPFWFWRYVSLGMLLAGIATGGYFLLNRNNLQQTGIAINREYKQPQERKQQTTVQKEPGEKWDSVASVGRTSAVNKKPEENKVQGIATAQEKPNTAQQVLWIQPEDKGQIRSLSQRQFTRKDIVPVNTIPDRKAKKAVVVSGIIPPDPVADSTSLESRSEGIVQPEVESNIDTVTTNDSTKVDITPPAERSELQKEKSKKKNRIVFSAGIGLQQAIAFGGQRPSSYNLKGKQNKFSDHIPSVYLRLQRDRWFLQGELHYKVPQPVEPFLFSQISSYDRANNLLHTERLSVQKLYYHQLPISINYLLQPQWSLGAGLVYNRLAGAVTGQETTSRNMVTGGDSIAMQVVPVKGYKDSFLYQSTAGIILQTDYHWRRISLGLRYTKNLQPFIKYTQPDGTVFTKKNQVLQAVLRFRLF